MKVSEGQPHSLTTVLRALGGVSELVWTGSSSFPLLPKSFLNFACILLPLLQCSLYLVRCILANEIPSAGEPCPREAGVRGWGDVVRA